MPQSAFFVFLFCAAFSVASQTKALAQASTAPERHAAAAFSAARSGGPLTLHAFLERMPKGADLHMHLSGAVYAETFLKEAAEDQLCVDPVKLAVAKSAGTTNSLPPQPVCTDGTLPAANVFKDQKLYDAIVDGFSMRSFVPSAGVSGHDWFFGTFGRYSGLKDHTGEWLDEVATRAAAQNEQYLEVMQSPTSGPAIEVGRRLGWPKTDPSAVPAAFQAMGDATGTSRVELEGLRKQLLDDPVFRNTIAADRAEGAAALADREQRERCATPAPAPACKVKIRFLGQVARSNPPERVFAQTLLYFEVVAAELASADPKVVGINFVQPEDAYMAMSEYYRQMQMLNYLHSVYPGVHITLHAGELAPGLVPPAGLRFHIREAVELGQAERIGHGVDVMYETDPNLLLEELAKRHVMVEINLTSNDVILGINPPEHPLPQYLAAHVPVALSTDDEGVSRIDLTHEYTRAALEFGLGYVDLKRMARTSLEHSFLPGPSLWANPDDFARVAGACSGQTLGGETSKSACRDFLKNSARASQQWELERRFAAFEARVQ